MRVGDLPKEESKERKNGRKQGRKEGRQEGRKGRKRENRFSADPRTLVVRRLHQSPHVIRKIEFPEGRHASTELRARKMNERDDAENRRAKTTDRSRTLALRSRVKATDNVCAKSARVSQL